MSDLEFAPRVVIDEVQTDESSIGSRVNIDQSELNNDETFKIEQEKSSRSNSYNVQIHESPRHGSPRIESTRHDSPRLSSTTQQSFRSRKSTAAETDASSMSPPFSVPARFVNRPRFFSEIRDFRRDLQKQFLDSCMKGNQFKN